MNRRHWMVGVLLTLVVLAVIAPVPHAASQVEVPQGARMWDYKIADADITTLNRLGDAGWELVSVNGNTAYLKRPSNP